MIKVGEFYKVSYSQFEKDWRASFATIPKNLKEIYDGISLPKRATSGSAGYDFFAPTDITIPPKTSLLLPTGIRAKISSGAVLAVFPRSGLGFKFRMQLNNTVGIIDADYFGAENEGHIMLKIFNDTNEDKTISVPKGQGVAQGIFLPFGITFSDNTQEIRTGGFGSTSRP